MTSSKYGEVPNNNFSLNIQVLYIFGNLRQNIHFNEDDANHHDRHQEPQEDQGHHPSMGRFLIPELFFT